MIHFLETSEGRGGTLARIVCTLFDGTPSTSQDRDAVTCPACLQWLERKYPVHYLDEKGFVVCLRWPPPAPGWVPGYADTQNKDAVSCPACLGWIAVQDGEPLAAEEWMRTRMGSLLGATDPDVGAEPQEPAARATLRRAWAESEQQRRPPLVHYLREFEFNGETLARNLCGITRDIRTDHTTEDPDGVTCPACRTELEPQTEGGSMIHFLRATTDGTGEIACSGVAGRPPTRDADAVTCPDCLAWLSEERQRGRVPGGMAAQDVRSRAQLIARPLGLGITTVISRKASGLTPGEQRTLRFFMPKDMCVFELERIFVEGHVEGAEIRRVAWADPNEPAGAPFHDIFSNDDDPMPARALAGPTHYPQVAILTQEDRGMKFAEIEVFNPTGATLIMTIALRGLGTPWPVNGDES